MKVAFATIVDMDSCIVKILTDEGIVGYGEAAPLPFVTGDNLGTVLAVGKEMREALIGMDPRAIGAVHRVMDRLYSGNGAVKAGIDTACYDIAAKAAGVPLYKYLGGDDPHIHSDVTIGIDTPERMADKALEWIGKGFDILKVKLGEDIPTDIDRMCAIHEAVAGKARLRIDANQAWSPKQAVKLLNQMQEKGLDIELVEQPVKGRDFEGLRYVTERSYVPVMADESVFSAEDAMTIMQMGAADLINIKLMKCGGIHNALKIASAAEVYGMECMIGCMLEAKVSVNAAVHLACAKNIVTKIDLDGPVLCSEDPVLGGSVFNEQLITVSDDPGLGIHGIEGITYLD
jgi:L-alanine-DL-glutamate epimerase-like enolase superfamily enzyme